MNAMTDVRMAAGGFGDAAPLVAFLVVVSVTLLLCLLFGADSNGPEDMYSARHSLKPWRNSLALTGDSISVLTLLTTTGLVAVAGYDGTALAAATVGALAVLLVLAQPLRTMGRYTLGDTLDARFGRTAVRVAATVATLSFCIPLTVVQLTAAGRATAALVGLTGTGPAQLCTVFIGVMMICAAALTGMRGNTMLQAVKTVVLFSCMGLLTLVLMSKIGWSLDRLLTDAAQSSADPESYYAPGQFRGTGLTERVDLISMQVTVVLGAAVAPHMIMRVKAAEHGAAARRSVTYAIGMVGAFCVLAVVLGLGAAALAGDRARQGFDPQSAASLLQLVEKLSDEWGGGLLVAMTISAIFLTSLTVVAALALSAGAALVHDLCGQRFRSGGAGLDGEVRAMRWATPLVGVLAVAASVAAQSWNIQFLAQFAVTVAASAILPPLVYSLFWKRCTHEGLVWSVYTGLGSSVVLQLFGPAVSGTPGSLFPAADFAWFPLTTTGLVSVPAGFAAGWMVSRFFSGEGDPAPADPRSALAGSSVDDEYGYDARGV
ncbi:cation acetate symporter [Streptomyces sp. NPDC056296]|uniref:sodium:solute symporter family transporter n=1 Tax=Streptomyces sp. NPDC056296 TaxID=3345775 RepID=UPI0035E1B4E2